MRASAQPQAKLDFSLFLPAGIEAQHDPAQPHLAQRQPDR
jgi:hypothetical protein